MNKRTFFVLVGIMLMLGAVVAYRVAAANDTREDGPPAPQSRSQLAGTFLIWTGDDYRPVDDPVVAKIGGKEFLVGKHSGNVGHITRASEFSGMPVFVAIDSIVHIQQWKAK